MDPNTETVVDLDEKTAEAIAKHVTVDEDSIATKVAEKLAANKPKDKEVNKLAGSGTKAVEGEVLGKFAKESKEEFAVKQLLAALNGNADELAERNDHALKTLRAKGLINKATYLNAGTDADGGYIVPNDELLTDVLNTLSTYSELANEARVINLTNGDGLDLSTLTADVVMTEVGSEGGSKTVTKPTLGGANVNVREFAGIALMTKKLVRQAVIDVYGVLRDSFARAIAKKREELLLTDSSSGVVTKSGVVVKTLASTKVAVADFTWSDIKGLPFLVPVEAAKGGIYVFSRLLAAELDGMQDTQGRDLDLLKWDAGSNMTGTTKNGYRFIVAETLGATDAVSTVHAIFGNFKQYAFIVRQGAIDSAVFDSGTVTDGSSVEHNLIQENKLAMRVETWENVGYPLPGAFVRARTAAS